MVFEKTWSGQNAEQIEQAQLKTIIFYCFVDEEKRREEFYNSRGFSKLKKGIYLCLSNSTYIEYFTDYNSIKDELLLKS